MFLMMTRYLYCFYQIQFYLPFHQVPSDPKSRAQLRVGLPDSGVSSWNEGEFLVFDDSFEQEIWVVNPSVPQGVVDVTKAVLLLSVDVWHPNLPQGARDTLKPMPY